MFHAYAAQMSGQRGKKNSNKIRKRRAKKKYDKFTSVFKMFVYAYPST